MNISWSHTVTILLLAGLATLLWKEWKRKPIIHLRLRMVATVLALLALMDLAIPFRIFPSKPGSSRKQAILLSPGYAEDSVKKFMDREGGNPTLLRPAYYARAADSGFESLHLFGFGLSPEEIHSLQGLPLVFHPSPLPAGIETIDWERKIIEGNRLVIQGRFYNPGNQPVRLFLTGMNYRLDSISLPPGGHEPFQLSTLPLQLGRYRYRLIALGGKDTLEKEWIPLEVIAARPIRMLMLASSPGFETKFLSQWLSRRGYPVVVRTQISKNKYGQTFLNEPAGTLDPLSFSWLQSFDLLISDAASLASLSPSEKTAIRKQMEEAGLGLVVRCDSSLNPKAWWAQPFRLLPSASHDAANLRLRFADTNDKGYPINTEPIVYISREKGTQVWVRDSIGNSVAGSTLQGAGRKVLVALTNTYSWILAGDSGIYEKFWSPILQKTARPAASQVNWRIENSLPKLDQQVDIGFETGSENIPHPLINETRIAMAQDPFLPFRWRGKFWPHQEGWQAAIPEQGDIFWWWAFGKADWLTLQYAQQLKDMQEIPAKANPGNSAHSLPHSGTPLPRIIPFLLFMACCTYLWIENKLYGHRN